MDIKAKENKSTIVNSFTLLTLVTMLYNCTMCICFTFLAWSKNWWGVLFFIPFCALTPSCKPVSEEEKTNE